MRKTCAASASHQWRGRANRESVTVRYRELTVKSLKASPIEHHEMIVRANSAVKIAGPRHGTMSSWMLEPAR